MTESFSPDVLMSHAGFVRALALGLLRDRDLADDVVQETMLAAIRRPPRDPERLRGWLGSVAKNLSLRVRRGRARRDHRERGAARPDGVPSAADVATRLESEARLVSAVQSLDEPYRTAVVLRYHDGLGPTEIAHRLGEPVRTVETRLRRALSKLRARLQGSEGDRDSWRSGLLLVLGGPPSIAAATTAAAGSSTLLTGALLMSVKTKILLGVATVALLSFGTWKLFEPPEPPPAKPSDPGAPVPAPEEIVQVPEAKPPLPVPPSPPADDLGACHGRIVYADGSPAAGEMVWPWDDVGSAVTTDADGRYRLGGVEIEAAPRTLMIGPRHACNTLGEVAIVRGEDTLADFTVERALSLTIQLKSPEPLDSVRVSLLPAKGEKNARGAYGVPNSEGFVTLSRLKSGKYAIRVDGPGLRPHREMVDLAADSPAGPHRIDLVRAEKLLVTVQNLRPGARPEYILMISERGGTGETYRRRGTVRDDGVIEETAPPPGTYQLTAFVGGLSLPSVPLEVPEHGAAEARVVAPAGAEVAGRVVPADGLPAGGAKIRLTGRFPTTWTPQTEISDDGSFRLTLVPHGTYAVHLDIGDQLFSNVIEPITVGPEGVPDLLVTLGTATGVIEGRLVGYSTAFPAAKLRSVVFSRREGEAWTRQFEVSPSYDGAFRAGHLPAGRWRIEVEGSPLGGDPPAEAVEFELGPGEKRTGIELVGQKTAGVTLRFLTAAGEPFTSPVSAHVNPESGGEGRLLILKPDADGRCVEKGLAPGVWKLMILGGPDAFTTREIEVLEGSKVPITIRLW